MPSFGREVEPWVSCRRFAACKRSLNWRGSRKLRQNNRLILAHMVPPCATRISRVVDVGVPGSECGNIQTGGGGRVSTISLLGCSTSVASGTGPTDEEECQKFTRLGVHSFDLLLSVINTSVLTFHDCSWSIRMRPHGGQVGFLHSSAVMQITLSSVGFLHLSAVNADHPQLSHAFPLNVVSHFHPSWNENVLQSFNLFFSSKKCLYSSKINFEVAYNFYYSYSVSFWNQIGVLHWKWFCPI